jgi:hypothetical protein
MFKIKLFAGWASKMEEEVNKWFVANKVKIEKVISHQTMMSPTDSDAIIVSIIYRAK